MEVHKHPHPVTHKKKWTEYLLEFLIRTEYKWASQPVFMIQQTRKHLH